MNLYFVLLFAVGFASAFDLLKAGSFSSANKEIFPVKALSNINKKSNDYDFSDLVSPETLSDEILGNDANNPVRPPSLITPQKVAAAVVRAEQMKETRTTQADVVKRLAASLVHAQKLSDAKVKFGGTDSPRSPTAPSGTNTVKPVIDSDSGSGSVSGGSSVSSDESSESPPSDASEVGIPKLLNSLGEAADAIWDISLPMPVPPKPSGLAGKTEISVEKPDLFGLRDEDDSTDEVGPHGPKFEMAEIAGQGFAKEEAEIAILTHQIQSKQKKVDEYKAWIVKADSAVNSTSIQLKSVRDLENVVRDEAKAMHTKLLSAQKLMKAEMLAKQIADANAALNDLDEQTKRIPVLPSGAHVPSSEETSEGLSSESLSSSSQPSPPAFLEEEAMKLQDQSHKLRNR